MELLKLSTAYELVSQINQNLDLINSSIVIGTILPIYQSLGCTETYCERHGNVRVCVCVGG